MCFDFGVGRRWRGYCGCSRGGVGCSRGNGRCGWVCVDEESRLVQTEVVVVVVVGRVALGSFSDALGSVPELNEARSVDLIRLWW